MKQDEKSQLSKERILTAAIAEFGTKNYENASLNNICHDHNISKGLIYHYFKNKDELYLSCVKACFDELNGFLGYPKDQTGNFQKDIQRYFDRRYQFFAENPLYSTIFFNTVLQPPQHLSDQIRELRKAFDLLNTGHYRAAIHTLVLRDGISEADALEYFFAFQEMFNGYFQSKLSETADFDSMVEAHENRLSKILNIMLYGIAKEKNEL